MKPQAGLVLGCIWGAVGLLLLTVLGLGGWLLWRGGGTTAVAIPATLALPTAAPAIPPTRTAWPTAAPAPPAATAALPTLLPTLPPTASLPRAARRGALAPELRLLPADSTAAPVSLDELAGKPRLVFFWTTWCNICRAEMPDIEAAAQAYASSGLVVLGVAVNEDGATVQEAAPRLNVTFPLLVDPEAAAARLYGVRVVPMLFFIDRRGVIVRVLAGEVTRRQLHNALQEVME
jgi:peroxiredoxin